MTRNTILPVIIAAALTLLPSCRALSYTAPDGRTFNYLNCTMDTKAAIINIQTPDGVTVHIENLDTNTQALTLATEALKLANKLP